MLAVLSSDMILLTPAHAPYPETAIGYPLDMQGSEIRRTCRSRSLTQTDRMLLYRWPASSSGISVLRTP
ncbi:hypothetical protein J3F83DRAFT_732621 [Trichoderma novae-zelandiae]